MSIIWLWCLFFWFRISLVYLDVTYLSQWASLTPPPHPPVSWLLSSISAGVPDLPNSWMGSCNCLVQGPQVAPHCLVSLWCSSQIGLPCISGLIFCWMPYLLETPGFVSIPKPSRCIPAPVPLFLLSVVFVPCVLGRNQLTQKSMVFFFSCDFNCHTAGQPLHFSHFSVLELSQAYHWVLDL